MAKEAPVMPQRERGLGSGEQGACEAGRTLAAPTSPASGARHQGLRGSAQTHQVSLPSPVSVVGAGSGLGRGQGTGAGGAVTLEPQKILRDPGQWGTPAAAELRGGYRRSSTPVKTLKTAGPILTRQLPATRSHHQVPIPRARG